MIFSKWYQRSIGPISYHFRKFISSEGLSRDPEGLEYLGNFLTFAHKIFASSKILSSFAADINSLIEDTLIDLETKLKVPILAVFLRFLVFLCYSLA